MQLTDYTDYSQRTLMYLAIQRDRRVSISAIAKRYDISRSHLVRMRRLARGGFIEGHLGNGGGLSWHAIPQRLISAPAVRYTRRPAEACGMLRCRT